jgi:3D (Asp-Asp-Asp) domain-containing protein
VAVPKSGQLPLATRAFELALGSLAADHALPGFHNHPEPLIGPMPPPHPVLDGYAVTITAYSSEVAQTDSFPFLTATGGTVRPGIIALSRDLLASFTPGAPFRYGDRVWLDGYGEFLVDDTMNARWRSRVDIWLPSTGMALAFGRKQGQLYLTPDASQVVASTNPATGDWRGDETATAIP